LNVCVADWPNAKLYKVTSSGVFDDIWILEDVGAVGSKQLSEGQLE